MSDLTENNNSQNAGENAENNEEEPTLRDTILDWVKDIAIALILAIIISLLIKPTIVKESSMEPNFNSNDYIFLSRTAYKFGREPKRGDVIVFRSNSDTLLDAKGRHKLLIKRVVGIPDDKIKIAEGKVYVNGEEADQSFTKDGETWVRGPGDDETLELTVPEDTVFCMGDNREVSVDSRSKEVGCIDQDTIIGKAVYRLLPLSDIGVIKNINE